MLKKIQNFILHPAYHDSRNPDYKKANILALGLLISFLGDSIYAIYFFLNNSNYQKNLTLIFGLSYLITTFFLLKYTQKLKSTFVFLANCVILSVVWGVFITGGIYSTNLIWFLVLSINIYIYMDRRIGIIYSIFCFFIYILFFVLSYNPYYDSYFKEFIKNPNPVENFFNIGFASLFSYVIIYAFVKYLDELNLKIKQVNEEKLQELNAKILEKTEQISKLRTNLARDFHDEMGNKLAGINVLSEMLVQKIGNHSDTDVINALTTIQLRSKELFMGTKDFIWSVDFKSDYLGSLFQYVKEFGEDFFSKLNISFYSSLTTEDFSNLRLEISVGRQVVAIFKEAMTNIAKHSEATEVTFQLEVINDKLQLHLIDNGKGFDIKKVSQNGLINMQTRAFEMRSSLLIESEISKGTKITLSVPLYFD